MRPDVSIFIYHDTKADKVLIVDYEEQKYLVTSVPSIVEMLRSKEKDLNIHYVTSCSADRIINLCDARNYRKI